MRCIFRISCQVFIRKKMDEHSQKKPFYESMLTYIFALLKIKLRIKVRMKYTHVYQMHILKQELFVQPPK